MATLTETLPPSSTASSTTTSAMPRPREGGPSASVLIFLAIGLGVVGVGLFWWKRMRPGLTWAMGAIDWDPEAEARQQEYFALKLWNGESPVLWDLQADVVGRDTKATGKATGRFDWSNSVPLSAKATFSENQENKKPPRSYSLFKSNSSSTPPTTSSGELQVEMVILMPSQRDPVHRVKERRRESTSKDMDGECLEYSIGLYSRPWNDKSILH